MNLTPESQALLDRRALDIYSNVMFDLAAAATAIEKSYGPEAWDARKIIAELPSFQRGFRALCVGLDMPLEIGA